MVERTRSAMEGAVALITPPATPEPTLAASKRSVQRGDEGRGPPPTDTFT